jgi:pyruvate dehydrogenase E2 component (dihydrolipoamide acetyltransferase)
MPVEITMPQLSDTMTEGTVVKWNKKEGDKVRAQEEVADVETDKATMPMEAFDGGTLAVILVKEGEKVPVGGVLAVLATSSEKPEDVKKQYASGSRGAQRSAAAQPPAEAAGASTESAPKAKQSRQAVANDRVPPQAPHHGAVATLEGAAMGELHEPDEVGHGATREPARAVPPMPGGSGNGNGKRVFASPLARRIAADKGVDLSGIQGSGPGGRVVQKDVLAAATGGAKGEAKAGGPTRALTAVVPRGQKQVMPLTKMRAAIAAALQRSKQQIPHFYETVDVDVEAVSSLRAQVNKQLEAEKVKLSLADFISMAVCQALLRHPAVNATFDEKKGEITRHGDVNLGIAVAIPDGLIVPVLRGADQMRLRDLRVRSADLIDRARAQRLKQDEMTGGTFTISSLGTFGVREFSAIINPPQVAILAVGAAEPRAVVRDGHVVARTTMSLTLSADHRAVDGATAAEFLRTLKGMLEEPALMLMGALVG